MTKQEMVSTLKVLSDKLLCARNDILNYINLEDFPVSIVNNRPENGLSASYMTFEYIANMLNIIKDDLKND